MSWLRIPKVKSTRLPASAEPCAAETTDQAFWYAASLARRIANSHPKASFRELPQEDLHEAGLIQDDNSDLYVAMRDAVSSADESLMRELNSELHPDLQVAVASETCAAGHRKPIAMNSVKERFTRDYEDPASTMWRDASGKTFVLLKPTEGRSVSESSFVWALSFQDCSEQQERDNAQKLHDFGLASSISDVEHPSASGSLLLSKGVSYSGHKFLFGKMTKGMAREHSNISMKAAAFGGSGGMYQSIASLPAMFVWVEHNYVSA